MKCVESMELQSQHHNKAYKLKEKTGLAPS